MTDNYSEDELTAEQDRTGWKLCRGPDGYYRLVHLRIPKDAKRVTGDNNKSRCDKAEVVSIFDVNVELGEVVKVRRILGGVKFYHEIEEIDPNYSKEFSEAYSVLSGHLVDMELTYNVGETIEINDFDTSSKTCSSGIHFFFSQKGLFEYFKNTTYRVINKDRIKQSRDYKIGKNRMDIGQDNSYMRKMRKKSTNYNIGKQRIF